MTTRRETLLALAVGCPWIVLSLAIIAFLGSMS